MTLDQTNLLSTPQAADLLNVSLSYLEKGRVMGYGPRFMKLKGVVRYRYADIEAWLEENLQQPGGSKNG